MFSNLTVKTRLFCLIGLMSLLAILLSVGGLYGMKKANDGLQSVYLDRTLPLADLAEIRTMLLHNRTAVVTGFSYPEEIPNQHKKIEENVDAIITLWEGYMATYLTPEEKILADKFMAAQKPFASALRKVIGMQKQGNIEEGKKFYFETVRSAYKPISETIDALIKLQKEVAKQEYETAQERYKLSLIVSVIFLVVGLLLSVFLSLTIINQLMANVGGEPAYVAELVRQISNGDLSAKVKLLPNDKSSLLYSITRMREALNNAIISVNITMDEIAQGELDSRITGSFKGDYNKIKTGMNSSLDTIQATLNEVMHVTNAISNGDLKQKITGDYHGAFGKTKDSVNYTVDVLNKLVEEIESIVYSGADCGDFSVKMTMHDKVGYGKRLAELINQLFGTTEKSLTDVLRVAEALADGNLTQTIDADYVGTFAAVKFGMNSTVDHLKLLIGQIKKTTEVVAMASKEISAGNIDLSHRTEDQAASLQQTAASMEELSAAVKQNTDNAKRANGLAEGASTTAKKGVAVVDDVVKTMSTINESSHKIVDIITVIDDIAFQTNILALNAAVEAARAGDSGKGFAVVAIEVRNLAQRAANAAGEIKRLIDNSVEIIADGSKQVSQAGNTMEDILEAIYGVTTVMTEIATASIQQSAGIEQIHQAVIQMDSVTQQNAALVQQASTASESLKEQTYNLAFEMSHFKTSS
jgi:methyl-accepting chemotaxis protein